MHDPAALRPTGNPTGRRTRLLPVTLLCATLAAAPLTGCAGDSAGRAAGPSPRTADPDRGIDRGLQRAESAVQPRAQADGPPARRPAAMIAGEPVSDAQLVTLLGEAAGAAVLEEITLDRLLRARMNALGLRIGPGDVEQERRFLMESIARDAGAGPDQSRVLLDRLQRQRGLGPVRFAALLERNAMLRAIVAPSVTVSEDQVQQALTVRYGERRSARILVRNSQQEAGESLARIQNSGAISAAFTDEASRNSTDRTAARGGLLEPINTSDPAYPASIRAALASLQPGQLSPVIALDRGFAVLLLESIVPPESRPGDAEAGAREQVTRRAQRVAMDRLARDLLLTGGITVFDDGLRWSWEGREQGR